MMKNLAKELYETVHPNGVYEQLSSLEEQPWLEAEKLVYNHNFSNSSCEDEFEDQGEETLSELELDQELFKDWMHDFANEVIAMAMSGEVPNEARLSGLIKFSFEELCNENYECLRISKSK